MTRRGALLVLEGEGVLRATPFLKGGLLGGVAVPLRDGRHVLLAMGTG